MAKVLIYLGLFLLTLGTVQLLFERFFKMPGDIIIRKPNMVVYIPIGTSILLSIILSIIVYIISRLQK